MIDGLRFGLIVALVGSVLAAGASMWQQVHIKNAVQRETLAQGTEVVQRALARLDRAETLLRGTRGFVMGAGLEQVTTTQFRRYFESRDLARELPGIMGLGLIVRVPFENEAAYLRSVKDRGAPDFRIRQLTPHDGERRVIQLVEPIASNHAAVGLDVASESMRLATTNAALASDYAVITGPVRLVQSNPGSSMGLLMMLAVNPLHLGRDAPVFESPAFVYAPIQADDLLLAGGPKSSLIRVAIADTTDPSKPIDLQLPGATAAPASPGEASLVRIVMGRSWRFELHAQPSLVQGLNLMSPHRVLLGGLLASALAGLMGGIMRRQRSARQQTLAENMGLVTMLDQASDAIIGLNLDAVVTFWNRGASRAFGYTSDLAVGHPLTALTTAPKQGEEVQLLIDNARQGLPTAPFETQRRHRDGRLLDVEISGGPAHDPSGRVVGVVQILRPIADRLAQVRGLQAFGEELAALVAERTTQLEQTGRDMRTVLDALPSFVGSWDKNLHNRFANAAYARHFGRKPEELVNFRLPDLLGDTLYAATRPYIEGALRGDVQAFDRELPSPDDTGLRYLQVHYIPQVVAGEVLGFYVLAYDVTDVRRAQTRLGELVISAQQAEERFRIIFDAAPNAKMMVDRQGRIALVNRQAEVLFGYERSELLGNSVAMLVPDSTADAHGSLIEVFLGESANREAVARHELMGRRKDGMVLPVEMAVSPVETQDGVFTLASINDISARRLAETERERALALMSNSIDAVGAGMAIYDLDGRLAFCNARYREMFPLPKDLLVPGTPFDVILRATAMHHPGRDLEPDPQAWIDRRRQSHRDGGEWVLALGDGRHIRVVEHVLPDGQLVSLRIDVSDLARATEAAEQASRAKSDFLANTSHEIRTPLNAILGLTYLLQREVLPEDPQRMVGQIQLAGRALLNLVNDVLDLAKIEAGQFNIEEAAFELDPLLKEVMELFSANAMAKGLRFELTEAPELPALVVGDPQRLRQILQNLLSNAIKFTATGGVSLKVLEADEAGQTRFSVVDTGMGVEPETLARLFRPFTQAEASITRQFGGTGLGLSIVAKLAELMGGSAGARSTPGQGSEFWVDLPLPSSAASLTPAGDGRAAPVRVLVADDDDNQRATLVRMARSLGWDVEAVPGGQSLVAQALAAARQGRPFEAVVADWDMPDLDGLSALALLRDRMTDQRAPAAVVVSAHDIEKLRASEHAHLADALLLKPVDASALFNAVNNAIGSIKGARNRLLEASELENSDAIWLAGVRVLVVDDSSLNLEVARRVLELENAQVSCCGSGEAGLALLEQQPQGFDIVLMDVQMPGLDGHETVRRLRAMPGLRTLPVVALSAGVQPRERAAALAAGMDDFLSKPLDPPQLVRCVRRLVERARGTTVPVLPRAARGQTETAIAIQIDGIDEAAVSAPLRDDRGLYLSLLKRFLAEFGQADQTPAVDLPQRLHKLRGSAQVVGALAVAAAAGRLESAARQASDAPLGKPRADLRQRLQGLTQAAQAPLRAEAARLAQVDQQAQSAAISAPVGLAQSDLQALVALMERQSLDTMPMLSQLEPALRTVLSSDQFGALRAALDVFNFSQALTLVRALGR